MQAARAGGRAAGLEGRGAFMSFEASTLAPAPATLGHATSPFVCADLLLVQLAQLRRQTHKRSSAALLGGIEEPAHKLRSSSRRPAAQAAAQQAGGGATSAGGQPLQSTHQSR